MKCSICKEEIKHDLNGWDKGHNADPINNGKCCGFCNDTIVSVTRLTIFAHRHESK